MRTTGHQIRTINKETWREPDRISGVEKYNNWNRKFTGGLTGRFEQQKKESASLKIGEEQNNRGRKESKRSRASETWGAPLAPKIHIKGSRKRQKEGPEGIFEKLMTKIFLSIFHVNTRNDSQYIQDLLVYNHHHQQFSYVPGIFLNITAYAFHRY